MEGSIKKLKNNTKKIVGILVYYILRFVGLFIKKDDNYIVFGSWLGKSYIDNPRYLFEYMIKLDKDYKLIWVGERHIKDQLPESDKIIFCKRNSLKSIYYIMKSKYAVFCQGIADLFSINIYKETVLIYPDHGIPVKKWEMDDQRRVSGKLEKTDTLTKLCRKITDSMMEYDYFVSASYLNTECICSALKNRGAAKEKIIKSGTPRNDVLFNYTEKQVRQLKQKYAKMLGFDLSKKVILYAPTFRRTNTRIETFCMRESKDIDYIKSILMKHNAILIEKNHFATYKQNDVESKRDKNNILIKLPENYTINIQEMLLFTDILISDYSGVFLDFTLLNRPIIHFAFDYEYYRDIDSGLYYDISDFSAGAVTRTFDETCEEIDRLLSGNDKYQPKRKYVRDKYLEYEHGNACQTIYEYIFNRQGNNAKKG